MAKNYKTRIAVATLISELTGSTLRVSTVRSAQAESLLPFSEAYYEAAKGAYTRILSLFPTKEGEKNDTALEFSVIFGCSRGLCGGLDAKIAAEAKDHILGNAGFSVFGERTAALLGVEPCGNDLPDYSSCEELARKVSAQIADGSVNAVRILRAEGEGVAEIFVFPAASNENLYLVTDLPREELMSDLLFRYLAASFFLEAVRGYAAQQKARLRSMDRATENAEKLKEELISADRRARQEQITCEIIDNQGNL